MNAEDNSNMTSTLIEGWFGSQEILACLSFPKTLASQGRGQRIFSARSRACGPFQLFCFAPKTEVFTHQ